jgi:hypothetical protein
MRVAYLTGETIYLRALTAADKEIAVAWSAGPFPTNAARAEDWLRETHTDIWRNNKPRHYAIAQVADDATIGGVRLALQSGRRGFLTVTVAPWCDDLDRVQAEVLGIVVPWARDDLEMMTLTVQLAADETATIAAAEGLGLTLAARLREFVARPGGRVDRVLYQVLYEPWRLGDA